MLFSFPYSKDATTMFWIFIQNCATGNQEETLDHRTMQSIYSYFVSFMLNYGLQDLRGLKKKTELYPDLSETQQFPSIQLQERFLGFSFQGVVSHETQFQFQAQRSKITPSVRRQGKKLNFGLSNTCNHKSIKIHKISHRFT